MDQSPFDLTKRKFVISIQQQGIAEMGVAACNPAGVS